MKQNHPKIQQEDLALVMLNQQKLMLSRIVWLLVSQLGGQAIVDEHSINPLWQTHSEPTKDNPPKLKITAEKIPEPTPEQLDQLTEMLRGTDKLLAEEMATLKMPHPYAYIEKALLSRVVLRDKHWVDAALAAEQDKESA